MFDCGGLTKENVQILCKSCNSLKGINCEDYRILFHITNICLINYEHVDYV